MIYHAKLEFEGKFHYWFNYSKDKLIENLLIPFVNGQIVVINRDRHKKILNMKNVTLFTAYKTQNQVKVVPESIVPPEMTQAEFEANECTLELINEFKNQKTPSPVHSVLQMAFAPPKSQVFVIMKFGSSELDSAYEGVFKPVIEHYGYKAIRIDEIQDAGKITDQVLEYIATSKYVLADLTGQRPNCYYEAGFAHALGKPLILTVKSSDKVHFDLAGYRFIQWETEAELRRELNKRFQSFQQERQV